MLTKIRSEKNNITIFHIFCDDKYGTAFRTHTIELDKMRVLQHPEQAQRQRHESSSTILSII